MKLEYFIIPESKEVLKKKKKVDHANAAQEPTWKKDPWPKLEPFEQQSKFCVGF